MTMADPLLTDSTAPSFDDPLGMMAACHRRIERQLATLSRLQRHLPEHGCDADAREAARAILRYFDAAAVNHHADEEDSVFPRLEEALALRPVTLMAELEDEHARLGARWTKLRPLLAAIAAGQRANLPPKGVAELASAYAAHIAREEGQLIPLAARTFDAATIAQIGREMAQRRGVAPG
jgi:hemerythrin-like domain-containing protein